MVCPSAQLCLVDLHQFLCRNVDIGPQKVQRQPHRPRKAYYLPLNQRLSTYREPWTVSNLESIHRPVGYGYQ